MANQDIWNIIERAKIIAEAKENEEPKMPVLPTIDDYLDLVLIQFEIHPSWRIGQTHFIVLAEVRPDLVRYVQGCAIDPFHVDILVPSYVTWLRTMWDKWEDEEIRDHYLKMDWKSTWANVS